MASRGRTKFDPKEDKIIKNFVVKAANATKLRGIKGDSFWNGITQNTELRNHTPRSCRKRFQLLVKKLDPKDPDYEALLEAKSMIETVKPRGRRRSNNIKPGKRYFTESEDKQIIEKINMEGGKWNSDKYWKGFQIKSTTVRTNVLHILPSLQNENSIGVGIHFWKVWCFLCPS